MDVFITSLTVFKEKEKVKYSSAYLMFSAESSGIGATVCTAGRFLLVAPFTKLEEEEEEEDPESTAPVPKKIDVSLKCKFNYIT